MHLGNTWNNGVEPAEQVARWWTIVFDDRREPLHCARRLTRWQFMDSAKRDPLSISCSQGRSPRPWYNESKTLLAMELLTDQLKARFAEVGRQDEVKDPIVIAKFFAPSGEATWFATEY